jgi:phosphoenolpyruvate phosphomutase
MNDQRPIPADGLKRRLNTPGNLLRVVGAHDALGARLIQKARFDGIWASSLEIATACGHVDDDTHVLSDVLPISRRMASCCRLPIVADCGTGGELSDEIGRLVRSLEQAGVAALCLEDARWPKSNSLLPGEHPLMPTSQFARKIETAKRACRNAQFVVIARLEALVAGAGLAEALWRGREYAAAGADAILIHSKSKTPDEVLAFVDAWDDPAPLVLIPTTYHVVTAKELLRTGKVRMVIYANQGMRAAIRAVKTLLATILDDGTTHHVEGRIATLAEVFEIQADFQKTLNGKRWPNSPLPLEKT